MKWAKGHYNSIRGRIEVEWHDNPDNFLLKVNIPTNTTATVFIPCNNLERLTESNETIKDSREIEIRGLKNNLACLKIDSGVYNFRVKE